MSSTVAGLAWVLLCSVLLCTACATVDPAPKRQALVIVGSKGALDPAHEATLTRQLREQSGSDVVAQMLDDIARLSHTPLYADNDVQLLVDGPQAYASMMAAIAEAEHHILLESYIFSDDEIGAKFANLLTRRSQEGVDVRIIYDSFGSVESGGEFFERMEDAGIALIEFNALNPLKDQNPLDINNRNHRKILVVDGRVAFTGGINLSGTYATSSSWPSNDDPERSGWRDTHVVIRGPAALGFQALFLDSWRRLGGLDERPIQTPTQFPEAGSEVVANLSAEGGDEVRSEIFEAYLKAIEVARDRIWITQAYFVPDKRFMTRLKQAAKRGVDVRIIVPGVSDSALVLSASRSRYGDLLEAGVNLYERQHALLHAKTAVIDGIWATVGSSNLDTRSYLHNDEANAVILGRKFAEDMEALFRDDLEQSRQVTWSQWKQRSLWERLGEKLSWLFEYWI